MVYICVYTHTQTEQNFARMKIRGKGMEQTMIKTENVSKRFGSFALQDIHFELPAGYICGLIGENGVGKTTLLNILAGLYEYDGTISIQEKEYRTNQVTTGVISCKLSKETASIGQIPDFGPK